MNLELCGSSELTILTMVTIVNNGSNNMADNTANNWELCPGILELGMLGRAWIRTRWSEIEIQQQKTPKAHIEGQIFVWLGF